MTVRLEGRDLGVAHGAARAIDGVTIALRAGELVALVGPNGSGKSTLLRVLLGAQRPSTGTVLLDGVALTSIATRVRARSLTMVVEGSPSDFAIRVRDLVSLGRIPFESRLGGASRADEAAVDDAMSAGELQRAHLARAFAQGAPILLLDEPTANLDPLHQLEAMGLLRGFVARGGAAIIALHDLSLAARTCDRVVVLQRGHIRADGAPSQVFVPEVLADIFRVKALVGRSEDGSVDYVVPTEPSRGSRGE
jgi:iron complex transport system ATP-binding protein